MIHTVLLTFSVWTEFSCQKLDLKMNFKPLDLENQAPLQREHNLGLFGQFNMSIVLGWCLIDVGGILDSKVAPSCEKHRQVDIPRSPKGHSQSDQLLRLVFELYGMPSGSPTRIRGLPRGRHRILTVAAVRYINDKLCHTNYFDK